MLMLTMMIYSIQFAIFYFQEELATNKEKTNRHLRLSELLQEHSSDAELIVMYETNSALSLERVMCASDLSHIHFTFACLPRNH